MPSCYLNEELCITQSYGKNNNRDCSLHASQLVGAAHEFVIILRRHFKADRLCLIFSQNKKICTKKSIQVRLSRLCIISPAFCSTSDSTPVVSSAEWILYLSQNEHRKSLPIPLGSLDYKLFTVIL